MLGSGLKPGITGFLYPLCEYIPIEKTVNRYKKIINLDFIYRVLYLWSIKGIRKYEQRGVLNVFKVVLILVQIRNSMAEHQLWEQVYLLCLPDRQNNETRLFIPGAKLKFQ